MPNHFFVILTANFRRFTRLATRYLSFNSSYFLEIGLDRSSAELEFKFGGDTFSVTRNSSLIRFRHSARRSFLNLDSTRSDDGQL